MQKNKMEKGTMKIKTVKWLSDLRGLLFRSLYLFF